MQCFVAERGIAFVRSQTVLDEIEYGSYVVRGYAKLILFNFLQLVNSNLTDVRTCEVGETIPSVL
jgi:hypothetical protein